MGPRRRRVTWTERAIAAVDEALVHIAAESPANAERVLTRILDAAASLSELSERGRIVPEFGEPHLRELIIPPFRLVYRNDETSVSILTLLHSAREFRLRRSDLDR